jgi:hypothetical protein
MTVQEALQDARAAGLDESARRGLEDERQRLIARRQGEEEAIVGRFADWDRAVEGDGDRAKLITWFKERLATRAYLRTVIDDLEEALGAGEESDVSHRRH